ncbi:MAG: ATP-binding protein [bacterium]
MKSRSPFRGSRVALASTSKALLPFIGALLFTAAILLTVSSLARADEWDENYDIGKQQFERGDWLLAIASFQAALQIQPQPDHQATTSNLKLIQYLPHYYLGKAHLMLGNYEAALLHFRQAIAAGAVTQTDHIHTLLRMQRIAETLLRFAQQRESKVRADGQFQTEVAELQQLILSEKLDQAAQLLAQLKNAERTDNRLALLEAWLQRERQEAVLASESTPPHGPAQAQFQQGLDFYLLGQYQPALQAFRRAENLDPDLGAARSWRQKTETEIERLQLDQLLAHAPEQIPEPEIIERIIRQTTAPVIAIRSPLKSVTETRDEQVIFSGRAGDDRGIDTIQFTVNGKPLVDAQGEVISIHPGDDEDARRFSFATEIPLRMGENQVVITAYDIDSPQHRTIEQYSVTRKTPLYQTPAFAVSLAAFLLLLVGGVSTSRMIKYRIAIVNKYNPYIAGAPIRNEEMFFGREALLKRILNTIHNNSLMIHGPRRIGKTSLQHQLKRRLETLDDPEFEFVPVLVDLQGTSEEHFFATLMEEILDACKPLLEPEIAFRLNTHKDTYSGRDLSRDLKSLLKTLNEATEKKLKLVLLIDEVDELNKYSEQANQRLRSVFMKTFAESLVAVMSGANIRKNWQSEGSPWYNFFEEIPLPPLEYEAAVALVKTPVSGIFSYSEAAIETIIEYSECRPYIIQKFCINVINRIIENKRRRVGVEDVTAVAPDVLKSAEMV